jgi:eukaryotic-like serine/threonine-protein kinase
MALSAGTRLGNFEILSTLGAGGMGVVYRARDTRLRREVALKILPDDFASDPERLDRFQREAQAVAALNHPNVVTIHSVEEVGGIHFLTMELIEGKTLVDLIPAGGLPFEALLKLALPLVDAMSAAHQRSIVHRDLKPANVMVDADGRVKVLDFGLAKLRQGAQESRDPSVVTTEQLTVQQRVLGTPAYMSPEQAEGKPVDARSDIFSLGVMLYEMATGTRPFQGDSALAIISSILRDAPTPLTHLRPDLPPDLDRIVRRCLAKEPLRRYQTALDVRNELEDLQRQIASDAVVSAPAPVPQPRPRLSLTRAVGMVAVLAVLAAVVSVIVWRPFDYVTSAPPARATFDQLTSQPGGELFASLSPDGRWVVYTGEGAGNRDIYLQSVSGRTPIDLTADSSADDEQPAFSHDGERIAFRSSRDGGGIFVMGRTGEAVRRVTHEGFNPAWSPDGTELAYTTVPTELRPQNAEQRGRLMVVAVNGGEPRELLDQAMLPSWSPRGLRIAFCGRLAGAEGTSNIATLATAGGDVVPVTLDSFVNWNPIWAPDGGHLYFVSNRGGSMNIWRVAIDETSGRPRGEPEPITSPASFATHLSISGDGRLLAYSAILETQNIQKLRLDPVKGEVLGEPVPVTTGSRFWANPDPSPDGAWVVFYSQVGPEGNLYVARSDGSGGMRQLTDDPAIDRVPRWSPDGNWIAMFSDRGGELHVWEIRADGSDLRQATQAPSSVAAWSPDGQRLAVTRSQPKPGQPSASIIDPHVPFEAQTPVDLPPVPSPNSQFAPNSWSPDGKRIAGQNGFTRLGISIYSMDTRTFERLIEFGEWPVWLPDSRRILFVSRGREFHILDTRTKATKLIFSVMRDTLGPPRLTRDGRVAFFSRRITEADVWIATLQ